MNEFSLFVNSHENMFKQIFLVLKIGFFFSKSTQLIFVILGLKHSRRILKTRSEGSWDVLTILIFFFFFEQLGKYFFTK